jgi:hypothetical protein
MPVRVGHRLEGLERVEQALERVDRAMHDVRPASKDIGEALRNSHKRRLAAGLDVNGRPLHSSASLLSGGRALGGPLGRFGRSLNYAIAGDGGLEFFSTFKGAAVFQRGGEIRPGPGKKFLTIPMRAKGGAFAIKGERSSLNANRPGARARDYKDTFFRRVRGKLYLFQKTPSASGTGAKIRALFLLVRSVRMPKNEWFGLTRKDEAMIEAKYLDYIESSFGRGTA